MSYDHDVRPSYLDNAHSNPLFQHVILTRKVGRTDLLCGVQRGFLSRSVHARLQVSVCNGYDLCHPS